MNFNFFPFFIFILLVCYFFVLPLCKKRPVIIKEGGLVIFLFSLAIAFFPLVGIWAFILGMVPVLLVYLLMPWFVYGVTDVMLFEALQKAVLATRAPIEKLINKNIIDTSIDVILIHCGGKTNIILFRVRNASKKAKLTVKVFNKFIQNYFI